MADIGSAENFLKEMEDSVICSLCLGTYEQPRALPCLHAFCRKCLQKRIDTNNDSESKEGVLETESMACPVCRADFPVPSNGVEGFPVAFLQTNIVDLYRGFSQQKAKKAKCKFHQADITAFCDTCSQLVCDTCANIPHKNHRKLPLRAALDKHKTGLTNTKSLMVNKTAMYDALIQDVKQVVARVGRQRESALNKVVQQEENLVQKVRDLAEQVRDEINLQSDDAIQEFESLLSMLESERGHLQGCVRHLEICLTRGTETDIIRTSVEDAVNFESTLQELGPHHATPEFTVEVDCPPLTTITKDVVATVTCDLDTGDLSSVKPIDLERQSLRDMKKGHFRIDFKPAGICCTAMGNIAVCESHGENIKVFAPNGETLRELRAPKGTKAFDLECTANIIYVTDRATESILVFQTDGTHIRSMKPSGFKRLSGICMLDETLYVTSAEGNEVCEMELTSAATHKPCKSFIGKNSSTSKLKLNLPLFVCCYDDRIAVSSMDENCVHVLDQRGQLKFTYGNGDPDQLCLPWGVTMDIEYRLFVAEFGNARISVLSPTGTLLGHIDLSKDKLKKPRGVAIDNDGQLLVACGDSRGTMVVACYEYWIDDTHEVTSM